MSTVGLLGGLPGDASWRAGADYLGRLHEGAEARGETVETVLCTMDAGEPGRRAARLVAAARACESAGADVVAFCSPALHADVVDVRRAVPTPLLHVADAVAEVALAQGWSRLLLLGASRDTEGSGCLARLGSRGLAGFLPDDEEQSLVDSAVDDGVGGAEDEAREQLTRIVTRAVFRGADAVVHLSPSISTLLGAGRTSPLPVVDALDAHVSALLDAALGVVPADGSAATVQQDAVVAAQA